MAGRPLSICVLGGTGFVGSELVTRLARDGHTLRVLTRNMGSGRHLLVLPTVELIVANVHDPSALRRNFRGVDVVVNLVGILNERRLRGGRFAEAHAELARKVAAAARESGVQRLLHMSSLGADARGAPSAYLRTKGEAEDIVRASGLDHTIFRPSVIFGPGDSLTNRFAGLLRLSRGWMPLAKARTRFAPVAVDDVAEAFRRALHGGVASGQVLELCGPEVLTLEGLVRYVAQVAGLPCRILPLADVLARLQALVMGLLPGKPFTLDNLRSLSVDSVCRENGFARLGIDPMSMSALVPSYLGAGRRSQRLDPYRSEV